MQVRSTHTSTSNFLTPSVQNLYPISLDFQTYLFFQLCYLLKKHCSGIFQSNFVSLRGKPVYTRSKLTLSLQLSAEQHQSVKLINRVQNTPLTALHFTRMRIAYELQCAPIPTSFDFDLRKSVDVCAKGTGDIVFFKSTASVKVLRERSSFSRL